MQRRVQVPHHQHFIVCNALFFDSHSRFEINLPETVATYLELSWSLPPEKAMPVILPWWPLEMSYNLGVGAGGRDDRLTISLHRTEILSHYRSKTLTRDAGQSLQWQRQVWERD